MLLLKTQVIRTRQSCQAQSCGKICTSSSVVLWEKKNTPSITLPKQKEEKLVMSTSPNASFHWSQHYSSAPTLMCRDQSLRETVLTFFLGYYTSHEGLQGERSSVQ